MNPEAILQIIYANIKEVKPELEQQDLRPTDKLAELGADSVERSEILMMTLEALQLNIPLVQTFGPANIGELAELLSGKL